MGEIVDVLADQFGQSAVGPDDPPVGFGHRHADDGILESREETLADRGRQRLRPSRRRTGLPFLAQLSPLECFWSIALIASRGYASIRWRRCVALAVAGRHRSATPRHPR